MTKLYIMRHSIPMREFIGINNSNDVDQLRNEKNILSVEGEKLAQEKSMIKELQNIDVLYSSNYVRAMSTARYIAYNNNIDLNIDEGLGERKFGVDSSLLPKGYFKTQWVDHDFKMENGESVNDTSKRMKNTIDRIINENNGKTICMVSHGTAMAAYLLNYCNLETNGEEFKFTFNGNVIAEGFIPVLDLYELEFDNNNELISIKNIR